MAELCNLLLRKSTFPFKSAASSDFPNTVMCLPGEHGSSPRDVISFLCDCLIFLAFFTRTDYFIEVKEQA